MLIAAQNWYDRVGIQSHALCNLLLSIKRACLLISSLRLMINVSQEWVWPSWSLGALEPDAIESESHVWLFATPWTLQSMEFSRPEYWGGQPFPSPADLPNTGIEVRSPTLQVDSLPAEPPGKPKNIGVGSLSLFQGIFLTQESSQDLLHCRRILYQLSHQGSPWVRQVHLFFYFHQTRPDVGTPALTGELVCINHDVGLCAVTRRRRVCSDHDAGVCVHVCTCRGNGDTSFSWVLAARPSVSRDMMNGTAGAVFTKVRQSSPRLMFSMPVGRFSKIKPICHLHPTATWQLAAWLFFFILTPGLGEMQFSDMPLKNCLGTRESVYCYLFTSWGFGVPE